MIALLCAIAWLRVYAAISYSPAWFQKLTNYSNALTAVLLTWLAMGGSPLPTFKGVASLAACMSLSFWGSCACFGLRSLYGSYSPDVFDVFVDHLVIPMSAVAFAPRCSGQACAHIALVCVWLSLTSSKPYPVFRDHSFLFPCFALMLIGGHRVLR